jgi:hypothetical protein
MRATLLCWSTSVDGHAGDGCNRLARLGYDVEVLDGAKHCQSEGLPVGL